MPKANAVAGGQNEVTQNKEKNENGVGQNDVNNIEKNVEVWTGQNDVINNERKQEDNGGQTEENGIERKEENNDNIEVINKDDKGIVENIDKKIVVGQVHWHRYIYVFVNGQVMVAFILNCFCFFLNRRTKLQS